MAAAFEQLESEPLVTPSPLEAVGPAESDAELRALLTDALATLEAERGAPGVLVSPQHQLASLLQSYLVEHPHDLKLLEQPAPSGGLEVRYDSGDVLGWARSVLDWWRRITPEPWREPPEAPDRVGDGTHLRVAVLGDWGTGLYGAPACARSIENDPKGFDLLVHLGDVYYSGTPKEVRENFIAFWPKVSGALSRALNSNHEMYSGGEGLYKVTMPAFGQAATCWSVETDHWLLVGLDSAYEDHDLAGDQAAWLRRLLARSGQRRVVLFCHHQPYSLLGKQGPRLVAKLGDVLDAGRVFAWYWGHEHRCVLYDPHPVWNVHGRCLGHGGFPYFRDDLDAFDADSGNSGWRRLPARNLVPGGVVLDLPNDYIEEHGELYGANGYAILEFDGASVTELVVAPDGTALRTQMLS
jgi:hypothetical protein